MLCSEQRHHRVHMRCTNCAHFWHRSLVRQPGAAREVENVAVVRRRHRNTLCGHARHDTQLTQHNPHAPEVACARSRCARRGAANGGALGPHAVDAAPLLCAHLFCGAPTAQCTVSRDRQLRRGLSDKEHERAPCHKCPIAHPAAPARLEIRGRPPRRAEPCSPTATWRLLACWGRGPNAARRTRAWRQTTSSGRDTQCRPSARRRVSERNFESGESE